MMMCVSFQTWCYVPTTNGQVYWASHICAHPCKFVEFEVLMCLKLWCAMKGQKWTEKPDKKNSLFPQKASFFIFGRSSSVAAVIWWVDIWTNSRWKHRFIRYECSFRIFFITLCISRDCLRFFERISGLDSKNIMNVLYSCRWDVSHSPWIAFCRKMHI